MPSTDRRVSPAQFVGVTELAQRASVQYGTVQKWRARHADFPSPLVELAAGPLWYWPDVAAWLSTPRPPGPRPRDRRT